MSRNDERERDLDGIRPGWAAVLMLAFAASACSGTGADETVLDEPDSAPTSPLGTTISSSSEEDEPLELTTLNEGLTGRSFASVISWHRWTKGNPNLTLMSAQTHFCALSMLRGHFASGTAISLGILNGNWVMAGATQASGLLEFDAVCAPYNAFLTNRGANLQANDGNVGFNASNFTGIDPMLSFTAPVLSSITGAFNGWGEKVWVEPWGPNILFQNGTAAGWHVAKAHALNFGRDKAPIYTHDFGLFVEPFETSCLGDNDCNPVPSLHTDFCFLHKLSGKLRGRSEWVQVIPKFTTNTWEYAAHAGADGKIETTIRCLAIDQR